MTHVQLALQSEFAGDIWIDRRGIIKRNKTMALLDRLTHHCHIIETGNDSYRFKHSTSQQQEDKNTGKIKSGP